MTRLDLQRLAQIKFDDAVLLLANQRYCNAYYLAGYSVEMALKACIAKQIRQEEIPDKALIEKVFTHEYAKLIGLSGLSAELRMRRIPTISFKHIGALQPNGHRMIGMLSSTRCLPSFC